MLNISTRTHVTAISTAFEHTSTKPPRRYTDALQRNTTLSAAIDQLGAGDLYAAIAAAADNNRDPAADAEVQRLVTSTALANHGVRSGVAAIGEGALVDAVAATADEIVATWRKPFDAAARELIAARQVLGDIDLADSDAVVRRGGTAADTWATATKAVATLEILERGWLGIHTITAGQPAGHLRMLRWTDASLTQFEQAQLDELRAQPWPLTTADYTLTLPTISEYRKRIVAFEAERTVRAQREQRQQYKGAKAGGMGLRAS